MPTRPVAVALVPVMAPAVVLPFKILAAGIVAVIV